VTPACGSCGGTAAQGREINSILGDVCLLCEKALIGCIVDGRDEVRRSREWCRRLKGMDRILGGLSAKRAKEAAAFLRYQQLAAANRADEMARILNAHTARAEARQSKIVRRFAERMEALEIVEQRQQAVTDFRAMWRDR